MTADDYVGVTLGTFTFFVWALIGFMQCSDHETAFNAPRHKWERLKAIDADDCGVPGTRQGANFVRRHLL